MFAQYSIIACVGPFRHELESVQIIQMHTNVKRCVFVVSKESEIKPTSHCHSNLHVLQTCTVDHIGACYPSQVSFIGFPSFGEELTLGAAGTMPGDDGGGLADLGQREIKAGWVFVES